MIADWIQDLKPRQFVMRRYLNEQDKEPGVFFVRKTSDMPTTPYYITVPEIKEMLLKKYGVPLRDAIEAIVQRTRKKGEEEERVGL